MDNSYGTSWADQWDSNPDTVPERRKESAKSKYGKKVGDGLVKTKAVAATGMKKVKEGTSLGLHWIKEKYNKRNQKH